LAQISEQGRDVAGYDAAAWHASDALQSKEPKPGNVVRYIARKTTNGWQVFFGRLDERNHTFLVAYEATQGARPVEFTMTKNVPPIAPSSEAGSWKQTGWNGHAG
jgi:hypothetical protein